MVKVLFVCVHNSARSQMAEALGKKYASDVFESYSAGTETKLHINQDAVRLIKEIYAIDMEVTQYSKLLIDLPTIDIVIKMGCNVVCPYLPSQYSENWGLEDPSGKSDYEFITIIKHIEKNVKDLAEKIKNNDLSLS